MKAFIVIFIFFNIITFMVFGYDKFLAKTNARRINEKTLITMALLGGSVGAVFGQKLFRHKTKKFKNLFWTILIVQFIMIELAWFYGSGYYPSLKSLL